jgi:hypothetical protein
VNLRAEGVLTQAACGKTSLHSAKPSLVPSRGNAERRRNAETEHEQVICGKTTAQLKFYASSAQGARGSRRDCATLARAQTKNTEADFANATLSFLVARGRN